MRHVLLYGAVAALTLSLCACNGKPTATGSETQSAYPPTGGAYVSRDGRSSGGQVDPRDAPVPQVNGKPMWAANRKHTAEENARYQFAKNGNDFAAKNESEYITKAHAFVDQPPKGVEFVDRNNGDRLIYDAKANVFAVVSKDGAPRTMFKPREGAAYWSQQKDREAKRGKSNSGDGQS